MIKYTSRDMSEIRSDLLDYLKRNTSWNPDNSEPDLTTLIIEVIAGTCDYFNYQLDTRSQENFLTTAKEDKSIRAILNTMGLQFPIVGSAKVDVQFTLSDDIPSDKGKSIVIPKYTSISAGDIKYITLETIKFDKKTVSVMALQGEFESYTITKDKFSKHYKHFLPKENICIDVAELYQDNSHFTLCDDAFLKIEGGKYFSLHTDSDKNVYILLTHNWRDYVLQEIDVPFTVKYLVSKGKSGMVSPLAIDTIEDSILDEEGVDVSEYITVSNLISSYGAFDSIDMQLAKANAKCLIRSMNRCITLNDYDAHVKAIPWVEKSATFDWQKDSTIVSKEFRVVSYVVPRDNIREIEKKYLEQEAKLIQEKGTAITRFELRLADFKSIDIYGNIHVKGNNLYKTQIKDMVESAIKEYFSTSNMEFGLMITKLMIGAIIQNVSKDITFISLTMDDEIKLSPIEFPILNELDIIVDFDDEDSL